MDIKIIFVDMDWTILNHGAKCFDMESIDALKKAQSKGVKVYIATARPYESMERTKVLDVFKPDGIITTNGGVIFENDQIIMNNIFPTKVVEKAIELCTNEGFVVEYSTAKERYFTAKPNQYVKEYCDYFVETDCPIKDYEGEEISALLLMAPKEFDAKLTKKMPPQLQYLRFHDIAVDLRYSRNNKGIAVNFVLNHLGISNDNALTIGDSIADAFMFRVSKYSACLENGQDEAKKDALYVAKHIDEHGVKDTLEHFKVI